MILRKPYAFLIKHFMIIHIALTGLMIYVCTQYQNIITFIKQYINNTASISTANTIISTLVFLAIFIIIAISFLIFWLMKYKKKPKLLYLFNIILYLILFILTIVLSSTFASLNNIILDSKTIRLYRDIVNMVNIAQYIFIIAMTIRTLGFDVKKFNFSADIQEMAIENGDNEEVEVNIGIDTNKIMRIIRRYLRELKYYYEENKLVIILLAIIAIIICIISISPKLFGKERTYSQNEIITNLNFQMNVANSYKTKLKYDGTDISIKDKTYIITKIELLGLYNEETIIDTSRFNLKIGKNDYYPSLKQYEYFSDLGYGYNKQKLVYNTVKPYILVFIVDNNDVNKRKVLTYTDINLEERKIKLNPIDLDTPEEISTTNLNEELAYNKTVIGDGTFKINSFEFADNYDLIYAGYNKKILKLDTTNNTGKYNNYNFFNNFVTLKYKKDDNEKKVKIINKTDRNEKNIVYLEVPKEIEEANSIYLEIKIRNNLYKYIIK